MLKELFHFIAAIFAGQFDAIFSVSACTYASLIGILLFCVSYLTHSKRHKSRRNTARRADAERSSE